MLVYVFGNFSSPDISCYSIYMAEEDGEVEYDFPPRSPNESVSRFYFPFLVMQQDRLPTSQQASTSKQRLITV